MVVDRVRDDGGRSADPLCIVEDIVRRAKQWVTVEHSGRETCRQCMYCVRKGIVSSQAFVVTATR